MHFNHMFLNYCTTRKCMIDIIHIFIDCFRSYFHT